MLVVILSIFAKLFLIGLLIPKGYMYSSNNQTKLTNMSLSQNNEIHYSSSNLLELRNRVSNRLTLETIETINSLGLKRKFRGTRSGKHVKSRIDKNRPNITKWKLKPNVNHNNLVRIKCNSSDFSSIALINALYSVELRYYKRFYINPRNRYHCNNRNVDKR